MESQRANTRAEKPEPEVIPPEKTNEADKAAYMKRVSEITENEEQVASDVIDDLLREHLGTIVQIRRDHPVENSDLISSSLSGMTGIKEDVRRKVTGLHQKLAVIIEEAASRIEEKKYESAAKFLAEEKKPRQLGYNERQRLERFTNTERRFNISCASAKVCVDLFTELNNRVLRRLDDAVMQGNVELESNLLIGNAVIIYELAEFLCRFIETYKVQGFDDFQQIHNDMKGVVSRVRNDVAELRREAEQPGVEPEMRDAVLQNAQQHEAMVIEIEKQWNELIKELETAKGQVETITTKLPTVRLMKRNASTQLIVLEAAEMQRVVRGNLRALESAIIALGKIRLAPLEPERVRRLLGITDRFLP